MNALRWPAILMLWALFMPAAMIGPVGASAADIELAIIPSDRADELVSILAPMVAPEGSVSAWQGQLIIRATAEKMALIKSSLDTLNKPLRNLLVQVRRRGTVASSQQSLGAAGRVVIRDGDVSGNVTIRAGDEQTQQQNQSAYSVRAIEGSTLFIATGSDIPVVTYAYGPGGSVTQEYVPVQSGMMVTPQLLADGTVLLAVAYQEASMSPVGHGVINRSGVASQTKLNLNEWTPFGAISAQESRQQSDVASRSRQSSTVNVPLEIRVEVLP